MIINREESICTRTPSYTSRPSVARAQWRRVRRARLVPPASVSAIFLDHNQSPAYLENTPIVDVVRRVCMPTAYVAITGSLRVRGAEHRLQDLVASFDFAHYDAPYTYNTNGPVAFVAGVLKTAVTTTTQSRKRARTDVENHLRNGTRRPSKELLAKHMAPGAVVEIGAMRRRVVLREKEPTLENDRYKVRDLDDNFVTSCPSRTRTCTA